MHQPRIQYPTVCGPLQDLYRLSANETRDEHLPYDLKARGHLYIFTFFFTV